MMGRPNRFEDLEAWQKAKELTKIIYLRLSNGGIALDVTLRDQIYQNSILIMINLAKGFEYDDEKEFQKYLITAKGLTGELKTLLYVATDVGLISPEVFSEIYQLAETTASSISALKRPAQDQERYEPYSVETKIRGFLK